MGKDGLFVGIAGTGHYVPERIMTNFDLEKMVDTSDEWIFNKIGVKTRHIAAPDEATSDLAYKAAIKALKSAEAKPSEIDLIVVATSTPDMIFPSTACIVQDKLGAKNAAAFDLVAVCSGFIYTLIVAVNQMIADSSFQTVLVIGAETYSRILNWEDRSTCVIFGDGAGAVVLKKNREKPSFLSSFLLADGNGKDLIKIPAGGSRLPASHETVEKKLHCFHMDSKKVFYFAVDALPKTVENALRKANLTSKDVDLIIPHQANINIIKQGLEKLNLPIGKAFIDIHKYANTAAASIPIALDEAVSESKVKENDILVLVGIGGGLTMGAIVLRW